MAKRPYLRPVDGTDAPAASYKKPAGSGGGDDDGGGGDMEARVERLERQTDGLIADVSDMKAGVAAVNATLGTADLASMARASAVEGVRENIADLKTDVRELSTRIYWLIGIILVVVGGGVVRYFAAG